MFPHAVLESRPVEAVGHGDGYVARPRSAPCRSLPSLDLEKMTQEAKTLKMEISVSVSL